MAADSGWEVAGSRRRRKAGSGSAAAGAHHAAHTAAKRSSSSNTPPTERQVQQRCTAVAAAAAEVAAAPFWPALSQQLRSLPPHCAPAALQRMVVYGLGSLEQPGAAHIRYQLALTTLLAGGAGAGGQQAPLLPGLTAAAEAYDPVFTPLDRAVLAALSVQVLAHDEGGRRVAAQPTLFWMPHCEAALTDALLAANLEAGTLHNVVVLGNRFSGYSASWALRHRAGQQRGGALERPDAMLRLCEAGVAQEAAVAEAGFSVASAFNDLGLHWFPCDWRQRLQAGGQPGVS